MDIDFTQVRERMDIQHLRSFLLNGKACKNPNDNPYKERLDEPLYAALQMITNKLPEPEDNEPLFEKVYEVTIAYMNVFMELGLQAGMKLTAQVLSDKTIF